MDLRIANRAARVVEQRGHLPAADIELAEAPAVGAVKPAVAVAA